MEILGIGPGEFFLIVIVLLVAVGPERLPSLARQAGKLLVRGRTWLQSSPDAALIMRARQEIEQELATLKSSLVEVQSVRDEVLGAAKQIGDSVGSLASTRIDLDDIPSIAPPTAVGEPAPELPPAAAPTMASAAVEPADTPPAAALPPAPPAPTNGVAGPAQLAASQAQAFASIELRLEAIMSDLFAIQEQLRRRGVLDDGWQPPSWGVSLPSAADTSAALAEPPALPETEEAPS